MEISFNQSRLTAGDIIDFQRATGIAFSEGAKLVEEAMTGGLLDEGAARAIAGLLWIARRKEDPEFTYEDALKLEAGEMEVAKEEPDNPLKDGRESLLPEEPDA